MTKPSFRIVPLLAGATLAFSALALTTVRAADPASGTIDDEHGSTTWTGLLLTPNPGGSNVPLVCEEGTPLCDVYRFTVNRSSIDADNDDIKIELTWADATT